MLCVNSETDWLVPRFLCKMFQWREWEKGNNVNVLVSFSSPKRHNKKRKGVETGTQPSSSQLRFGEINYVPGHTQTWGRNHSFLLLAVFTRQWQIDTGVSNFYLQYWWWGFSLSSKLLEMGTKAVWKYRPNHEKERGCALRFRRQVLEW